MFNISKLMLTLAMFILPLTALRADSNHTQVLVKGKATVVNPNPFSDGFNANVTKLNILARNGRIEKGKVLISSKAAGPIDPITGIDFEFNAIVDAVRVFADHPDVVWIHGVSQKGSITVGTDPGYGPLAGTTTLLNPTNGEFIGAATTWGRTNFLTVFENGNNPLPNFFTATEAELTALVGGFSRLFLTTGVKPGKIRVKTTGQTLTIP